MKFNKSFITILMVILFCGFVTSASLSAADKAEDEFYGKFIVGYRFVDISGVEEKYKEDINLGDGLRLFNFKIHFAPVGKLNKYFDYMNVYVNNFGGDPFETMGLDIMKYGKYKFKFDRRKSEYFYNDHLEGHDFHTFAFDRINDSGLLKLWLGKKSHAYIDFNSYTKKGMSVNTLDLGRVEFEFEKPIDEMSTEVTLGFDHSGKSFAFVLEEKFIDFDNANSMFLPGYADGGDFARYPTYLNYFSLNMPYNMKGNTHSAKFTFNPIKKLLLKGSLQILDQNTDFTYSEEALGADHIGVPVMYDYNGKGDFSRKSQIYDLDFTYFLSDKMALVGTTFYKSFDQEGSMTIDDVTTSMDLKYETGGVEAGIQFQPNLKFGFTLGYRMEQRDVEDEVVIEDYNEPTSKSGIFGNLNWKPSKKLRVTADYQYGNYDNPLTLISPTDFHRFRLTGKYKNKDLYFNGSYTFNRSTSDQKGEMWESDKNQLNLRFGVYKKKLHFSAGYALIDVTRKGERGIYYPPSWSGGEGTYFWDILFEGTSNLFDVYIYSKLSNKTGLGAYLNYYSNNGSWELTRTNLKLFFKYFCEKGFVGQLNYRYVDFKENDFGYNDYKANIFEVSFGYSWK